MSVALDDLQKELDRQLTAVGERGHRAVVAGVVRDGQALCRGWSADGPAPDGDTLFEIGSVTKAFTGVLLADMHLRGEVALDDPLSRHLPGLRPAWRHREPTLLELATHRSDLPNTPTPTRRAELAHLLGIRQRDPWADLTVDDYRRMVERESPRRAPGTRFRYSSMAVGLLGDALAARAGRSYERLLTERVLQPLGMDSTSVLVPPERAHRLLGGHSYRGHPRPPLQDLLAPAGSLRSSAEDMVRFLTACLAPPDGALGAALRLAQRPQARMRSRLEIGLCWIISTHRTRPRVVWHNGGTWGFSAFAGFAPERGTAAVVMSNTVRGVERAGLRLIEAGP
jgi:CubicO group peptidase (beta-lactamase class C family)